jgi:hypothetical protein
LGHKFLHDAHRCEKPSWGSHEGSKMFFQCYLVTAQAAPDVFAFPEWTAEPYPRCSSATLAEVPKVPEPASDLSFTLDLLRLLARVGFC